MASVNGKRPRRRKREPVRFVLVGGLTFFQEAILAALGGVTQAYMAGQLAAKGPDDLANLVHNIARAVVNRESQEGR